MPIRPSQPPRRLGFTLIEAALAMVVVSLIIIGALEAAGATARAQRSMQDRELAERLAESLLNEVVQRPYTQASTSIVGTLIGTVSAAVNRTGAIRVDAYQNFTENPPKAPDGTVLVSDNTWSRSATLQYVRPNDPAQTSLTDTGLVRVTVTVSRSGRVLARRSALKSADD